MTNSHIHQTYFSTSQAAKMLSLSVGTIQRMVGNGVFKAYVTQGGHRRILSSSLTNIANNKAFPTCKRPPANH
ncbi:MAG: helix-turn-helix domain-containing protein [Limnohabitans sp.]|nr:helix-turn-helix domain-containing protein [Limnohabitans sp.]